MLSAGCGENGDKAIAYGDGIGRGWHPPPGEKQMRIAVENSFTRDVLVQADAPGMHYEITVRPVRDRYMIVPEAKYEIKASTEGHSTGLNYLYVMPDDGDGFKGLRVKIRL